jgi:hypothetical protein
LRKRKTGTAMASQSSRLGEFMSFNPIDGGSKSKFNHTLNGAGQWWEVDLGKNYDIKKIVVLNRNDCCMERLKDSTVIALDENRNTIWSAKLNSDAEQTFSVDVKVDKCGGPVVEKNIMESEELKQLEIEYFRDLQEYTQAFDDLMKESQLYVESVNRSNPYLNKNISLGKGGTGYVTNRGVWKHYGNPSIANNTAGKNGCGNGDWGGAEKIENIEIKANMVQGDFLEGGASPLILGSPIISGQSCGNEGQNIYITQAAKLHSDEYLGSKVLGGNMKLQEDLGNNQTLEKCKQRAEDQGVNYYGMTNLNNTDRGNCYIGTNPNMTWSYTDTVIWRVDHPAPITFKKKHHKHGSWFYPKITHMSFDTNGIFRLIGPGYRDKGRDYFKTNIGGLPGLWYECWRSPATGGSRLTLKSDGNMVIYDNMNNIIWQSNTKGGGDALVLGDTLGKNLINNFGKGTLQTYITNDAGGVYGYIDGEGFKLINRKWNAQKLDGNDANFGLEKWVGKSGTNAIGIYKAEGANRSMMGRTAYINDDTKLSVYPLNLSSQYGDEKPQYLGTYDSRGNDIANGEGSVEDATKACFNNDECAGFVHQKSTNKYYLKNKNMYPRGLRQFSYNNDIDLYVRSSKVENDDTCGKGVYYSNQDMYNNYPKTSVSMRKDTICSLGIINERERINIQNQYIKLQEKLQNIERKTRELGATDVKLNNLMNKNYEKMKDSLNKYEQTYKDIFTVKKQMGQSNAMESDSEIQTLAYNYKYIIYSILAIGLTIGALRTLK